MRFTGLGNLPKLGKIFPEFVLLCILLLLCISGLRAAEQWQQKVSYQIDVTLIDSIHTFDGKARISYLNNSPDTLSVIWFRLPPEALNPMSPVDQAENRGRKNRLAKVPEDDWGRLIVHNLIPEDRPAVFVQDGSIGRVVPEKPLLPGDSISFTLSFSTRFPSGRATYRIGYMNGQYKGAYWYPQVCPYTPEYGWTVNRYFGTAEAYDEFADYTVRYTVPYKYIVASTGLLLNEEEVLPPDRLKGLNPESSPHIPIPTGAKADSLVTWIYQTHSVPDVAFAADPNFLVDRMDFGNFESWAFMRRGKEEQWSDAAELVGWTISELEKIYGKYPWPRVMATDSWSGMEYPMLTMMSGSKPSYTYVMIHEVTHNYTPMILHSNSVDATFLDEGFTTFIEHYLTAKRLGDPVDRTTRITNGLFSRVFPERDDVKRGKRPYLESVLLGEDIPMKISADVAEEYPIFRVSVYYKTTVMLNALRAVLGEDAFWRGFRIYYQEHKLSLVTEDDMIESFEKAAGRPLRWFFDQYLYSSEDIDYSIRSVPYNLDDDSTRFLIRRKGGVRLPIRLAVVQQPGDTSFYEVPFLPSDPELPEYERLGFWNQLHNPQPWHLVSIPVNNPGEILLDPYNRYTDRNPLDNRINSANYEYDLSLPWLPSPPPPVERYNLVAEPAGAYNLKNGFMPGFSLRGGFMDREEVFHSNMYLPVKNGKGAQFLIGFRHPLTRNRYPSQLFLETGILHGNRFAETGVSRWWRDWGTIYHEKRLSFSVGRWEREEGYHPPDEPTGNSDLAATTYLKIESTVSFPRAFSRFQLRETFLQGVDTTPFTVLRLKSKFNLFRWKSFLSKMEIRLLYQSGSTPSRFRENGSTGDAYSLRSSPIFGSLWQNSSDPRFPLPGTTASLTRSPQAMKIDRLAAWSWQLDRGLPGWMGVGNGNPWQRFLSKIRVGLFHSGAFASGDERWMRFELGPELRLLQLYHYGFTARLSPLWMEGNRFSEMEQSRSGTWRMNDWWTHTLFSVTYSR